jgi:cyclopropane-fatty-acyl-phospholipid synthase
MFRRRLKRLIKDGTLTVEFPSGRSAEFGTGLPKAAVRIHDWPALAALTLNPHLALGEMYMAGRLTVTHGDVGDLLALLMANIERSKPNRLLRAIELLVRPLAQFNPADRARAHAAHHYDLSGGLYDLFLDSDKQYSCAYFGDREATLDQAQAAKKRHILSKLALNRPGMNVLDIGCGWGGLALNLARDCGVDVRGITLSREQLSVAKSRAQGLGLSDRCHFDFADYRSVEGRFDRIISVGMFEHVGVPYYGTFFDKAYNLLADNGVMVLHTIGRSDGPGATNPWIAKYIFPGGYAPALSEVTAAAERSGFIITDVEVLRLHYAETLAAWRRRFAANRAAAARIYDERFCRMWEFYLAGAEMAFRHGREVVFQVQLAKRLDAVPITRDYMFEAEHRLHLSEEKPRAVRRARSA